jgi:Flp pilus assembly protein TadG
MRKGMWKLLRHAGHRFADRRASAAIEFALIAPILFIFLMGIIETGVIFLAQFTLQGAVNDVAREIRTGQITPANTSVSAFRQKVCDRIGPFLGCDSNLQIDVEASTNGFAGVAYQNPVTAGNTLDPSLNNTWPTSISYCSVVLVRAFYTWHVFTPFLSPFLSNLSGDVHLISVASAFRNEPYNVGVQGC